MPPKAAPVLGFPENMALRVKMNASGIDWPKAKRRTEVRRFRLHRCCPARRAITSPLLATLQAAWLSAAGIA